MPPSRRLWNLASSAVLFVVVSALAGVLMAVLVLPAVGAATAVGKGAAGELDRLPVEFDAPAQSQRSKVLDANGDVLAYFYAENRVYVGLDAIAPVMGQAIVAIEDHRFYEHGPLDLTGTIRAFLRNQTAGGVTQGGSTITQQYVKLVQVEEAQKRGDEAAVRAAQASTYARKIAELRYAISVERSLSKDEILERYLNIAYFGDGAYGIQVASQHYFGVPAAKLTLPQAALLAGLVQNPTALNPVADEDAALNRRNVVLNRMSELGLVSAAVVGQAKKVGFDPKKVTSTRNGCVGTAYPFLCDFVYKSLLQAPSLGADAKQRENTVKRGGLTVTTAIDPETQDATQKAVSRVVGATDPLVSVMDMIEPGTGLIVAMAQSRPVMGSARRDGQTYWNYSVSPALGGAQGFQAGSTFKAITAAAALAEGIPLTRRYDARRTMDFSGAAFESCEGQTRVAGDWRVSNSTGTNGVMDMYRATQRSVNTYFVQLALDVGMCDVTEMAEKLGVESSTGSAPISSYDDKPSFTLGTVEVSPLSVAEAYATFASGGIHCNPIIVDEITDASGASREAPDAGCERVISADVANAVNDLLGTVITQGTGARAAIPDGRPQAGKTGTIDSNEAVWFAGYTPEVAGVAMISIDNTRAPFVKSKPGFRRSGVKGYPVPSTRVLLEGSGSGDAGQELWRPAMQSYLRGQPPTPFEPAPASLTRAPADRGLDGPGGTGPGENRGPGQNSRPGENSGPGNGRPGR